jgi:hypothetical protein
MFAGRQVVVVLGRERSQVLLKQKYLHTLVSETNTKHACVSCSYMSSLAENPVSCVYKIHGLEAFHYQFNS